MHFHRWFSLSSQASPCIRCGNTCSMNIKYVRKHIKRLNNTFAFVHKLSSPNVFAHSFWKLFSRLFRMLASKCATFLYIRMTSTKWERMNRDNNNDGEEKNCQAHSAQPAIKTAICSLFLFYFSVQPETTAETTNIHIGHSMCILGTQMHGHIACNWPHLIRIFGKLKEYKIVSITYLTFKIKCKCYHGRCFGFT